MTEIITEQSSAHAIEIHIPSTENRRGSKKTNATLKTTVRNTEIIADIRPLLSAVKNADANIGIAANKNEKEKKKNPL